MIKWDKIIKTLNGTSIKKKISKGTIGDILSDEDNEEWNSDIDTQYDYWID